jgi:hypothetical protein
MHRQVFSPNFGGIAKIPLRYPSVFRGIVSFPADEILTAITVLSGSEAVAQDGFDLIFLCSLEDIAGRR